MKQILLTGASSGIGRATALALAHAGHRVIAAGRRREPLQALAEQAPGRIEPLAFDLDAPLQQPLDAIDRLTDGAGVDVLVNNAGFGIAAATAEIDAGAVQRQFDTNVFAPLRLAQALWPAMAARGGGRIINVSSLGGRVVLPMYGAYNATKFALEALSDALRLELAPLGIDVIVIEPSVVRTAFLERSLQRPVEAQSRFAAPMATLVARSDRLQRMAIAPEAVADAIVHAVTARRVAARIAVPRTHGWAIGVLRWLPTRLRDAMLRRASGMPRRAALPAAG
ncbi:MAG: SDR family oxidoreductase [Nannocystaceae bacterium]|nr:SDR family oxidoreductase [Nannocystaceae bacterium]